MLIDQHGRRINYVRLAVTDRCNLRCFYCMPEEGIQYIDRSDLLSYEEIIRLMSLFASVGIEKVRLTGGEPFLRKNVMDLIRNLAKIEGINKMAITSNGTLIGPHIDELVDLGIQSFNLSLDTLNKERFKEITRRDDFDKVWKCYESFVEKNIEVKVNMVVMANRNIEDIIPMALLTQNDRVSIRFIEEMPFNGNGAYTPSIEWNYTKILSLLSDRFGPLIKLTDPQGSTSFNYQIEGFKGSIGVIPAYSRAFCGSCNRIRITPDGTLKTCLYDTGVFNVKNLMRAGANDQEILIAVQEAISHKAKDGFEAEQNRFSKGKAHESMASIGG